jgi:hypothetical protein
VLLTKLLNNEGSSSGAGVKCSAGHTAIFVDYRSKEIITVLGAVEFRRAYYYCEQCGKGILPQDAALDLAHTSFSPGVRRLMGRVGGKESFNEGRRDLAEVKVVSPRVSEFSVRTRSGSPRRPAAISRIAHTQWCAHLGIKWTLN